MIMVCDTREQNCENGKLDFSGIEGIEKIEHIGLPYGDYTAIVHGRPVPIYYERKSFGDLWTTMASDNYERFKREMARAKEAKVKLILIIEGNYTDVWNGNEYSKFDGESMLKKLATLYTRYDLEYVFTENRRVMARRICDTFSSIERGYSKQNSSKISPTGAIDANRPSLFDGQSITNDHDD